MLLDALLGLARLHASGILHGDVKPPNILVDDRERGCLSDFDISIERTSARGIMTTTLRATALEMTIYCVRQDSPLFARKLRAWCSRSFPRQRVRTDCNAGQLDDPRSRPATTTREDRLQRWSIGRPQKPAGCQACHSAIALLHYLE